MNNDKSSVLVAAKGCVVALLSFGAASLAADAQTFSVDGLTYTRVSPVEVAVFDADASLSGAVVIPEKVSDGSAEFAVTSIGERAFEDCSAISSVTIPASVAAVGNDAFSFCSSLREVVISDGAAPLSVGYIPNLNAGLFADAPLAALYVGRDLSYSSRRGFSPFSGIRTLREAVVGNAVTEVGPYAFADCVSLASVTVMAPVPPSASVDSFEGVDKALCRLTVPEGTVGVYRSAPVWSEFPEITDGTASLCVPAASGRGSVSTSPGSIIVTGLPYGVTVVVSRVDGAEARRLTPAGCSVSLHDLTPGCYIVSVRGVGGDLSFRAMVP